MKLTYNALKEEWTLKELMSIVVQHEVSLKKNETHSLALVTDQVSNMKKKPQHKNFGGFKQFKRKGNSNQGTSNASASSNATKSEKFKGKCNFCHKIGHKQADCFKFKNWLERKRKGKLTAKTRNEKINRFGYVELIHEKSDFLNVFKAFKAKVELQLGKPIKAHSLMEWGCRKEESHIVRYVPSKSVPKTPYELWSGKKPSLHHFHVWGCKAEVRPYNPQSKKLDPKTISGFFVSYCIGSRGSRFYCPSHTTRIIESDRAVYFEDEVTADPNFVPREIPFGEEHVVIHFPTSHVPNVDVPIVQQPATNQGEHGDQVESGLPVDDTTVNKEDEYDGYDAFDPVTYQEAIHCPQFISWKEAMDDEMNSMYMNGVWDLVELPHGCKPVGSHFDLELHQMDVKTTFLNGDLDEEVYMEQPTGFVEVGKEDLVCKLSKSIYGLKQASRQWYLKFDRIITQNGFKENTVDRCIYLRVSESSYIFLVLYVDDILLASNDPNLLIETKHMLSTHFDMKDLGETSYVLGIKILRDRANGVLKLSQRAYIEKILKRFNMHNCKSTKAPIVKGDKFSKARCPQNDDEREEMRTIPYSSVVGNLMYLSNPGSQHWKAAKKVLR
ncbi:Retrovirus-related Pol polyprotein from transposon TNT 1-94 [Vitis vinifera]|uniref:Retrovirus-related Pol polyprotein from transposon TNT 1-94 n=1 Tax=Vitis vinifera TaxID=29760 RepID=A0A438KC92_VITVI|nr:Retrovirus-related Pol polyprotein from transposon TNT 1-94 [Vitis vinifera]